MRPATFSTENPPYPLDCLETREYIAALRRRIEVQNDLMESLVVQIHQLKGQNQELQTDVEALCIDLGIKEGHTGHGWTEVPK
jgi:hypothetical protein